MCNSSKVRGVLATIGLVTMLAACEDVPTPRRATTKAEVTKVETAPPPPAPVAVEPPRPKLEEPPRVETTVVVGKKDEEQDFTSKPLEGARQLLADGKTDKALKLAQLAVDRQPTRSGAWNMLGRVQLQMGKRGDALTSFEKATELNPRNSYAHNNLGLTLIYEKRFDEAADHLEQAVELDQVEGYMWNNLGIAYEQLDRLDDARDAYGKAAELDSAPGRDSLARLKGVKTLIRTAKVDTELGKDKDKDGKRGKGEIE